MYNVRTGINAIQNIWYSLKPYQLHRRALYMLDFKPVLQLHSNAKKRIQRTIGGGAEGNNPPASP